MTVFINPGPDLSAAVHYVESNSFFEASTFENEIEIIRNWGDNLIKNNPNPHATTDANMLSDYRRSEISWFDPHDATYGWLVKRLSDYIAYFNSSHWNFDLTGFAESIQYTVYNSNQLGHYDWHTDSGGSQWNSSPRKLSIIMQLSDPSEYDGGEFCIKTDNNDRVLSKKKGTLIIFPSYTLHKVFPVTAGIRRSLVCWIAGPKFR